MTELVWVPTREGSTSFRADVQGSCHAIVCEIGTRWMWSWGRYSSHAKTCELAQAAVQELVSSVEVPDTLQKLSMVSAEE